MQQHNVYTKTLVLKRILYFVFLSVNSHMVKGSKHGQFVLQYRVIQRSIEMQRDCDSSSTDITRKFLAEIDESSLKR